MVVDFRLRGVLRDYRSSSGRGVSLVRGKLGIFRSGVIGSKSLSRSINPPKILPSLTLSP